MKFEESMLSGFLDNELTAEEQVFLKRHLDTNPKDRQTLEAMAKLRAMLRQLPEESFQVDPVKGVRQRIAEQLVRPGLRDGGESGDLEDHARVEGDRAGGAAVVFSEQRPSGKRERRYSVGLWIGLATAASVLLLGALVFGPKSGNPMVATVDSQSELPPSGAARSELAFGGAVADGMVASEMMVDGIVASGMPVPEEVIHVELPTEKVDLALGWLTAQGAVQVGAGGIPPEDRLAILESRKSGEIDPTASLENGGGAMLPDGAIAIQFQIPAEQSASFIAALQQWGQASVGGQQSLLLADAPLVSEEPLPATVASDGLIVGEAGPGRVDAARGMAKVATPMPADGRLLAEAAGESQAAVPLVAPASPATAPVRMWIILRPQAKP